MVCHVFAVIFVEFEETASVDAAPIQFAGTNERLGMHEKLVQECDHLSRFLSAFVVAHEIVDLDGFVQESEEGFVTGLGSAVEAQEHRLSTSAISQCCDVVLDFVDNLHLLASNSGTCSAPILCTDKSQLDQLASVWVVLRDFFVLDRRFLEVCLVFASTCIRLKARSHLSSNGCLLCFD